MANINLLPWRRAQRARITRQVSLCFILSLFVVLVSLIFIDHNVMKKIRQQSLQNQQLQQSVALLNKQIVMLAKSASKKRVR